MNPDLAGVIEFEGLNDGYFLDFDHIEEGALGAEKVIYRFMLNQNRPLTFCQSDGTRIRPCATFLTDQGSIPGFLQGKYPKDRHCAYYLHDDQYRAGGAWIAQPRCPDFVFVPMKRIESDRLLRTMLQCGEHPVSKWKARRIYAGVRIGAAWDAVAFWRGDLWHPWRPGRAGTDELFPAPEKPDVDDYPPMGVGA